MEIQKQILLFFSGTHTEFQNGLVQFLTMFGEEVLLVAIAMFIYWNINKRSGYVVCMSLMSALTVTGIAKAIVRFPRPWHVIEELDVVRKHTATGYSFPSGHTTSAASAFTAIALMFKKRWLSIVCALAIILVGLSRLYLCVHWPLDVAGGLIIGCGVSFLLSGTFASLFDDKERNIKASVIIGCISALAAFALAIVIFIDEGSSDAFADLSSAIATLSGMSFGCALERSRFDYVIEEGQWKKKILRFVIGLIGAFVIAYGLKAFFSAVGIGNSLTRALRYTLFGFWGGVYPLVGKKLRLF